MNANNINKLSGSEINTFVTINDNINELNKIKYHLELLSYKVDIEQIVISIDNETENLLAKLNKIIK